MTQQVRTETACYVYGIVDDTPEQADLGALSTDRRLSVVGDDASGLAAVIEIIAPDRPLGRRADLLAHSEIVNGLAARGPVVPVRFGSVLPDPDAVVTGMLAPNRERFRAMLDELRGQAQFSLRARYLQDVVLAEVVAENPEVAALRAQTAGQPEDATYGARVRLGELVAHAVEDKRRLDAERIMSALTPFSSRHAVSEGGGMDRLLEAALLVPDSERERFEQAAEEVAYDYRDRARMRLLGPVAPFEFTAEV